MKQDPVSLFPLPVVRWTARRKAELIAAIEAGEITAQRARDIHEISSEELEEWWRRYTFGGVKALRATRTQIVAKELRLKSGNGLG